MNIPTERISRRQYKNELKKSKIGISPFGYGEFAYRDYEIIMSGCMLFKPDMSHIETWPDLYIENETYVPFKWDLSNFYEELHSVLDNLLKIREYARNAQDRFRWHRENNKARGEFLKKIIRMTNNSLDI